MSAIHTKDSMRNKAVKFLLFIISPFVSFLYSLGSLKTRSSYIIIFLFYLCFGMAFSVESQYTEYKGDGVFYRGVFESYRHINTYQYINSLKEYVEFQDGSQDFYSDTVAFVVSRFTGNYHYFFLFLALVFAFFQLKCLTFFTSNPNYKFAVVPLILLFLFMWNNIFNINGCRFWTAAWIGVYAVLEIFVNKKYRYLLLAAITPFFHGAFWIYVAVLFIGFFLRRFKIIWIVLFLLSFVFSSVVIEIVQQSADYLPAFLARKVYYYADEFYIQSRQTMQGSGLYWLDIVFPKLVNLYINVLVIVLIIKSKLLKSTRYYQLYLFFIVYVTISNFFMAIPSVGSRFIVLSYPMIALMCLEIYNKCTVIKNLLYLLPFVWFMNIYHLLKNVISVIDISFFISSPFYLFFKYLM